MIKIQSGIQTPAGALSTLWPPILYLEKVLEDNNAAQALTQAHPLQSQLPHSCPAIVNWEAPGPQRSEIHSETERNPFYLPTYFTDFPQEWGLPEHSPRSSSLHCGTDLFSLRPII